MSLQPGTLVVYGVIYFSIDMYIAWIASILKPSLFFELVIRCFWSASVGVITALGMLGRIP